MDSQVGPVILINKFNVKEEQVQEFLEAWQMMLSTLNNNQGSFLHSFIVELVEAACFSTTPFGNQNERLKRAFNTPEVKFRLDRYPSTVVASPHLFKKVAVPGICVD
jgi:hypothetical protein